MAINRFRPEIWSALLMESYKKVLVYANLCNRDYEGEIRAAGDTVRVTSISRPTISTYTRNADISYDELTDAQRTLSIDQEKYWAFTVDDVDQAQARGNVVPEAMSEAAYGLTDVVDQYVAGLYTGVAASNAIGTMTVTDGDQAYTGLRLLALKLDEANVPKQGRWAVVPSWYHSLLLDNNKFVDMSASGTSEPLLNGLVGRALGMTIHASNNAPLISGDDYGCMAGTRGAITMAEQVTQTEAMRSELRFGDRVRGLLVYGAKLMRPDGIATLVASQS
ncbi:P22 phage major capsid protein family protein [Salinispora vitiensis]|uniref:P22 phage major capsid protein family protein n=1 Tax=Salinispora vitiensis TaxID=999544 RepID=UPI0004760B09|nr:P22 phage major capsid protein family protein [Salinispora vitiensis]